MWPNVREHFAFRVRKIGGTLMAASRLGCTRSHVDMIIAGTRRPSLNMAGRISDAFGIPMEDWRDDPEWRIGGRE